MTAPVVTTDTDRLAHAWSPRPGLLGWAGQLNHKAIGRRFMVTAFAFFLFAGVLAIVMRTQLAVPNNDVLGAQRYDQFFTMHGTLMMFVFMVPMLEGIAIYVLPLMLGTRDLPFPRLTAFGYWTYLFGGLFLLSSFVVGAAPSDGWFAYVPLTTAEYSVGPNMDFWLLGITFVEISAILAAVELLTLILFFRAPGMALSRLPLFAWAVLAMSFAILFGFPPLVAGTVLLELERKFGFPFFSPAGGGDPFLWQHVFWFFGHPEVYIQLLPALGIVSGIVPVFARRRLAARNLAAAAVVTIAIVSFGLWVHHMYAIGLPLLADSFFQAASFMIAVPSGTLIFIYLATMWSGRLVWTTPMLFCLGFIVLFVLGGITGVMVAIVPFDWQVHDTYFVVAHFHYVLIGGVLFPIFAALYHWLPKITGRGLHTGMGRWNFWLMFVGFNLTFFPLHVLGLLGMPRRVWTYEAGLGWQGLNLAATAGGYLLGLGVAVFLANVAWSWRRGPQAGADPWYADTLEWTVSSPPPPYNFRSPPSVGSATPLWDQPTAPGDGIGEQLRERFAQPVGMRREVLRTTVLDARPQQLTTLPVYSLAPIGAAAAIGVLLTGILVDSPHLAAVGLLATVTLVLGWLWRGAHEEADVDPTASSLLPADARRSAGWWGLLIGSLALLALVLSLAMSYVYLRWGHDAWPPPGFAPPPVLAPLAGTGVAILAALVAGAATMAQRRQRPQLPRLLLGTVLLLGASVLWLRAGSYAHFLPDAGENVYPALMVTLAGVEAVLLATGLLATAAVLAESLVRPPTQVRTSALRVNAMLWAAIGVSSAVLIGTLHVVPAL